MDAISATEVRRVKLSEDLTAPGDYVFIPKRDPKVTTEKMPVLPPKSSWARIVWTLIGAKYTLKETVEELWPQRDTVIINCPKCNAPVATTKEHTVVSVEPLTIEVPVTCPYCKTVSFEVVEGKLITT